MRGKKKKKSVLPSQAIKQVSIASGTESAEDKTTDTHTDTQAKLRGQRRSTVRGGREREGQERERA